MHFTYFFLFYLCTFLLCVLLSVTKTVVMAHIHSDLTRIELLKTLLIHSTTRHAFPQPEISSEPIVHHVYYHEMSQQQ